MSVARGKAVKRLRSLFLSIFEWPFHTGFTVHALSSLNTPLGPGKKKFEHKIMNIFLSMYLKKTFYFPIC